MGDPSLLDSVLRRETDGRLLGLRPRREGSSSPGLNHQRQPNGQSPRSVKEARLPAGSKHSSSSPITGNSPSQQPLDLQRAGSQRDSTPRSNGVPDPSSEILDVQESLLPGLKVPKQPEPPIHRRCWVVFKAHVTLEVDRGHPDGRNSYRLSREIESSCNSLLQAHLASNGHDQVERDPESHRWTFTWKAVDDQLTRLKGI